MNVILAQTAPDLHTSAETFWKLAMAGIIPLVITGVRKVVPKIPVVLLPSMAPLLGIAFGMALNWLGTANLGWVDMVQAGAAAVAVREIWNNAVTKRLSSTEPSV